MELGLFTHGAFIWPVYRNFEAFIASLGAPGHDVAQLLDCPSYPVRQRTDSAVHGLPPALDERLVVLHRELYDALLRPVEIYQRERLSFTEYFCRDLQDTAVTDLLDAFMYYFIRRHAGEVTVTTGLAVVRSVFFNHESAEPALWLHGSLQRCAAERVELPLRRLRFTAPEESKLHDLAFCVVTGRHRPTGGAGWITGRARRELDGRCHVLAEFGVDPSLDADALPDGIARQLDTEVGAALAHVFGWGQEVAR